MCPKRLFPLSHNEKRLFHCLFLPSVIQFHSIHCVIQHAYDNPGYQNTRSKLWSGLAIRELLAAGKGRPPPPCPGGWLLRGRLGGAKYSNIEVLCCDSILVRSNGIGSVQKKSWLSALSASSRCFGSSASSLSSRSSAYWSRTYAFSLSFTFRF